MKPGLFYIPFRSTANLKILGDCEWLTMQIIKTERERILAGFLLTVFVVVASYWFLWRGQLAGLEELKTRRMTMERAVSQGKLVSTKLEGSKAGMISLKKELDALNKGFYSTHQVAGPLKAAAIMNKYGIVTGLKPGEIIKHKYYSELPLSMNVDMGFEEFIKGISELEADGRAISIEEVKLSSKQEANVSSSQEQDSEEQVGIAETAEVLDSQINLTIYAVPEQDISAEAAAALAGLKVSQGNPFKPFGTIKAASGLTGE